ncbi:MAG TPA: hypothetical protein VG963_34450 [Polyangiaceae bacterium]|nr:hypothetical protein [Polyangiaceae bacterium]
MNSSAAAPLDEAQLGVLGETRELTRKLKFARGVAQMNAVSLGVLAACSLPFELLDGSLPWMSLVLGALAWNEARGRKELLAAEPRALRRLAWNQIALLAFVLVYCAYGAYQTWKGGDPLAALSGQSAELGSALRDLGLDSGQEGGIGALAKTGALIGYAVVAGLSALVQGLTALYYASRRATVEALARMPAWARALA